MKTPYKKGVILTGATGFLGRNTLKELLRRNYTITVIVRRITSELEFFRKTKGIVIIEKPLEDLSKDDFIQGRDYTSLIHFAWGGVNRDEIDNTSIQSRNFSMSKNCLEVAINLGISQFINCGTRAEYGTIDGIYTEECICRPTNAYGAEKLKFYFSASELCKTNNISFAHVRPFSVIGPGDHPWSLIQSTCTTLQANEIMHVGKCEQLWNFLDISDFANCFVDVLENINNQNYAHNPIYNIASIDTRPLRLFLEELEEIVGSSGSVNYGSRVEHEPPSSLQPSIEKVSKLTGFKEKYTFKESVIRILRGCSVTS